MPVSVEQQDPHWLIRLDGQVTLAFGAELKNRLLEWLASRKALEVDLERVEQLDLAIMQLLWSAGRQAERSGTGFTCRTGERAAAALREAGFPQMPVWIAGRGQSQ